MGQHVAQAGRAGAVGVKEQNRQRRPPDRVRAAEVRTADLRRGAERDSAVQLDPAGVVQLEGHDVRLTARDPAGDSDPRGDGAVVAERCGLLVSADQSAAAETPRSSRQACRCCCWRSTGACGR